MKIRENSVKKNRPGGRALRLDILRGRMPRLGRPGGRKIVKNVNFSLSFKQPYFELLGASRTPKMFLGAKKDCRGFLRDPLGSPESLQNFPEFSHFRHLRGRGGVVIYNTRKLPKYHAGTKWLRRRRKREFSWKQVINDYD